MQSILGQVRRLQSIHLHVYIVHQKANTEYFLSNKQIQGLYFKNNVDILPLFTELRVDKLISTLYNDFIGDRNRFPLMSSKQYSKLEEFICHQSLSPFPQSTLLLSHQFSLVVFYCTVFFITTILNNRSLISIYNMYTSLMFI